MTCEKHLPLERSIPECRGQNRSSLFCVAQSSFPRQYYTILTDFPSVPNADFLMRGFFLGHFYTAFYAHIIPNISPFAHYKRRLQRGGFAPRIELAFGDSASLRGIRGKAGASEMRPYQDDMVDLHPALSSPSATPLRSGGYADKVKRADETSAGVRATRGRREPRREAP